MSASSRPTSKRQTQVLVGLGVVLAAILIFQVLPMMTGGDAQPPVTGAQVQLDALTGLLMQSCQYAGCQGGELKTVAGPGGQFGEVRSEPERTVGVPLHSGGQPGDAPGGRTTTRR